MKRPQTLLGAIFAFPLIAQAAFAGFFDVSPGKSGASFMRVPLSAKKTALGGGGTALAGTDFVETNPAALYGSPASLQFSHLMYFDGLALSDAKFTFSIESSDSYGVGKINNFLCLGLRTFSSKEEKKDMLLGTNTGSFSVNNKSVFLSYAFLAANYTGGITLKNISESIDSELSSTAAIDAGIIKEAGEGWTLGAGARNIGQKISGSALPLTLSGGITRQRENCTINADIEKSAEEEKIFSAGIEYPLGAMLTGNMALRGGLSYQDILRPSAGIGVRRGKFVLDYAFSSHKFLGQSHLFTLAAEF
jgi:hypothetical protein